MNFHLSRGTANEALLCIFAVCFLCPKSLEGFGQTKFNSPAPFADITIREIKSIEGGNHVFRAILKSDSNSDEIFIEKFQKKKRNQGNPFLVASWKLKDLPGGAAVENTDNWSIWDLEQVHGGFKFRNTHVSGSIIIADLECEIRTFEKLDLPKVNCKKS